MGEKFSDINIPDLNLFKKGKVRDIYELEDKLLFVASDRISAFDYVLPSLIPDKGKVLTQISKFWFEFTSLVCPNHMITADFEEFPGFIKKYKSLIEKRSMLVFKTDVIPIECIVRGYISGSAWKDYKKDGKVSGIKLPSGIKESDQLGEVIFTPSTKAEQGHDENISFKQMQKEIGAEMAQKIKEVSIALYQKASLHALSKGILIADTKFEFGLRNGELVLIDEIFTPDSSRFWPVDSYSPGGPQPSLDKQFVRDYLESTDWDKNSPPPKLPDSIIEQTAQRYKEIYFKLTGKDEL
ncbi:MAG TPA: phosphoribosylaminoimidazolesuccinocarboxamide synthase [Acidobacteriota bacterium]|nr:phosphoribosylaminoimidazolesuccinocarboxamide synthase [Acidobacteriota bacterium]